MSKRSWHVVPNPKGGWSVRHAGAERATRVFHTQQEATKSARTIARKERTELYVHGRDGTIRHKDSYGVDPFPSRDKR